MQEYRHRYDEDVNRLEQRLIYLGWGTLAIRNELAKQFPHRKIPAVNTIGKHVTELKQAGLIQRGRTIATKRPGGNAAVQKALRQNGHSHEPLVQEVPEPVMEVRPAEDEMLRVIRLAMRHAEDRPKVQGSLERLRGAMDVVMYELKVLGDLLSGE